MENIILNLVNILEKNNIELEYKNKSISIGEGIYGGKDGYYLSKNDYDSFDETKITPLFPINIENYIIELITVTPVEYDDDRIWKSSIHFCINPKFLS
jgi:hypothetical protein